VERFQRWVTVTAKDGAAEAEDSPRQFPDEVLRQLDVASRDVIARERAWSLAVDMWPARHRS
jgi:hypothetical protein